MELCDKSPNVALLIESFSCENTTYIVTKFYKAGDLMKYLLSQNLDMLPETEARYLFR